MQVGHCKPEQPQTAYIMFSWNSCLEFVSAKRTGKMAKFSASKEVIFVSTTISYLPPQKKRYLMSAGDVHGRKSRMEWPKSRELPIFNIHYDYMKRLKGSSILWSLLRALLNTRTIEYVEEIKMKTEKLKLFCFKMPRSFTSSFGKEFRQ